MKLVAIASFATLALAACAPVDPPPVDDGPDQCAASRYQSLIGKHRSQIPTPPAGANWRITCTNCPVTMDYNPSRLNIFYDERTEIVEVVKCG